MNTKKQSFLRHLNVYNFKFGTKLFIVFILLLILNMVVTNRIGIMYLKKFVTNTNHQKLSNLIDTKYKNLENEYVSFESEFREFTASPDLKNEIAELKSAYNNFSNPYSDSVDVHSQLLEAYYMDQVVSATKWHPPELSEIFRLNKKQKALQYYYLRNNPYKGIDKDRFYMANDGSNYSQIHVNIHKQIRGNARKFALSNFYLVDAKSGEVFYSLIKNPTFATSLFTGPYQYTHLATTFQKALAAGENKLIGTDYAHFLPKNNMPVGFIGNLVMRYGEKDVVAIAEIGPRFYQNMMIDSWMLYEEEAISLALIGEDHLLRTEDIGALVNYEEFFTMLEDKGRRNKNFRLAANTKSSALALGFNQELDLLNPNEKIAKNYLGKKAYIISQPVKLGSFNWSMVANVDIKKSVEFIKTVRWSLAGINVILFLIAIFVIYRLKYSITNRLAELDCSIQKTAGGEISKAIDNKWADELGNTIREFEKMKERVENAGNFTYELSKGNFETEFKRASENDRFANALNTLKENLKKNKEEAIEREKADKIQTWINEGIAKFNDLLRQSNDNIQELAYLIIENLIEYLEANLGGVFMVEGENEQNRLIKQIASFAYDRRKYHTKTIEVGEGLIGNCYLERKPILLKQIPDDYIELTSGLGKTKPKVIYIVPLLIDERVLGFIELASLEDFPEFKLEFINRLADNIAATFSTVRLNSRTAELLEESKRRANEIAQQEEEMRQNMEEMQATQEELARLRDEDEKRTQSLSQEIEAANKMIQQLLNGMDGEVLLKDSNGTIVLANEEAALRFNSTPEKMRGKTNESLFTPEKAQREAEIDELVLKEGIHSEESFELVGNVDVKYFIVKKQFFLPTRKEAGILTIRNKRS